MSRAQAAAGGGGRRGCTRSCGSWRISAGIPMPQALHDPGEPAERLRDGPQPQALGGRRHAGHHAAAERGRAARRAGPRAGPHPQPRHPDHDASRPRSAARSRGSRTCCCSSGGDDDSPLGLDRGARDGAAGADRGDASSSSAISRQREFAADATGARIAGSSNALADALERLEAGAKAMPMQVNSGRGAAVHRQAVQRRRHRVALLDPPPDRGARAPAPGDGVGA